MGAFLLFTLSRDNVGQVCFYGLLCSGRSLVGPVLRGRVSIVETRCW